MGFIRFLTMVFLFLIPSLLTGAGGKEESQTQDLNSLSDEDLKAATIILERTRCYGNCPAYTVTVHGDGRVEYLGKSNVKVTGPKQGRIEPGTLRASLSEFVRAKYLSLPDYSGQKCTCGFCTDMPSAITELSAGSAKHRVDHYYGCRCAPRALFDLESAIDKAARVEQWTGDTSKQGPYGTTCTGG